MVVEGRDRDAFRQEARHDVLDLLVEEDEIAHDHDFVPTDLLERGV
jgi:hypothetical protein